MTSEARMLTANNAEFIAEWCGGRVAIQHDPLDHDSTTTGVNVPVQGGVERAQVGDMIIREGPGLFRIAKRERE